jgi:hypothetical protein
LPFHSFRLRSKSLTIVVADKIIFDLDFSCAEVVGESSARPHSATVLAAVVAGRRELRYVNILFASMDCDVY